LLGKEEDQENKFGKWLQQTMLQERYGWFRVLSFPKCCIDFFEWNSYEFVVQEHYVSTVRTNRLEGDSSGADSKNYCSCWENSLVDFGSYQTMKVSSRRCQLLQRTPC
jgi:hypothetical protein